jgi:hypothetical protein
MNPSNQDVLKALKTKGVLEKKCPLCGVNQWRVVERNGSMLDANHHPPSIRVVCENCGNTHFLDWDKLSVSRG